jgi:predicted GNAT family N-acyltransferase
MPDRRIKIKDMSTYTIRIANWQNDDQLFRSVREDVFVKEQQVPVEMEWDGFDSDSLHVLAIDKNGRPIGTARLLPDGHIGRMAVLKEWRKKGVGSALLRRLLVEVEKRKFQQVALNSQRYAVDFYKKFGFQIEGDEFIDAGIPHVKMVRNMQ